MGMATGISQACRALRGRVGENIVGGETAAGESRSCRYRLLGGAAAGLPQAAAGFVGRRRASIRQEPVIRTIRHLELTGSDESVAPDVVEGCSTRRHSRPDGSRSTSRASTQATRRYWHSFSPGIHHHPGGESTEPRFGHTRLREPPKAGAEGVGRGATSGGAAHLLAPGDHSKEEGNKP